MKHKQVAVHLLNFVSLPTPTLEKSQWNNFCRIYLKWAPSQGWFVHIEGSALFHWETAFNRKIERIYRKALTIHFFLCFQMIRKFSEESGNEKEHLVNMLYDKNRQLTDANDKLKQMEKDKEHLTVIKAFIFVYLDLVVKVWGNLWNKFHQNGLGHLQLFACLNFNFQKFYWAIHVFLWLLMIDCFFMLYLIFWWRIGGRSRVQALKRRTNGSHPTMQCHHQFGSTVFLLR